LEGQVAGGSVGDPGFIKVHSNQLAPKGVAVAGKGLCNAVVWNSLIHDIDWLQQEFGPIKRIFAQGVQKSRPKLEYVMATFTLKGGVIAQVIHSYQSHGENTVRAEICGTTGIVQYDSTLSPIRGFGDAQKSVVPGIDWAGQWSAFEAATVKRSVIKKVSGAYAVPVKIAGLVLESIRSGAPKTV
jgi:predicted dehydrogenase